MNLGYMGKPYDSNMGLYNYGYRDYKPEAARFTTVDPIRDGSNWFVYVNSDPVNYVDLWGLEYRWIHTQSTREGRTVSIPDVVEVSEETYERHDDAYYAASRDLDNSRNFRDNIGSAPERISDGVRSVERRITDDFSVINSWSVIDPSLTKQVGSETRNGTPFIYYDVRFDEASRLTTVRVSGYDLYSVERIQNCGD